MELDAIRALEHLKNHIQHGQSLKEDIFYSDYQSFLRDCIISYVRKYNRDTWDSVAMLSDPIEISGIKIKFNEENYYEVLWLLCYELNLIKEDEVREDLARNEDKHYVQGGNAIDEDGEIIRDEDGRCYLANGYVYILENRIIEYINNL